MITPLIIIIIRFIKHEFTQCQDLTLCTPDFSYNTSAAIVEKVERSVQQISDEKEPQDHEIDDPDVTQLEIDIDSTFISPSQKIKKRQLIVLKDDFELNNDIFGCSTFQNFQN